MPSPHRHGEALAWQTIALAGAPAGEEVRGLRVDRGAWVESHVAGCLPSRPRAQPLDAPGLVAALGTLARWLGGGPGAGGAAHLRLFVPPPLLAALDGAALDVVAPAPRTAVDCFVAPAGQTWVAFQGFAVAPRHGGHLIVSTLDGGGRAVVVEAPAARLAYLSRIVRPAADRARSLRATYGALLDGLRRFGFAVDDLARTWCFFADLLGDYPTFNPIRSQLLDGAAPPSTRRPPSTGIQGRLPGGEPLCIDALAIAGPGLGRATLENPAQREATAYGSAFSRGLRLDGPGPIQWIVSGTAAIGRRGETLAPDDPAAQVDATVAALEALLDEAGFGWEDVATGMVYVAPPHLDAVARRLDGGALGRLPLGRTLADICRPDLAVEAELIAFR